MSQCTCGDQKKTCRLGCFSHLYMSPSSGTQVTRLVLQAPHLLSPSLSQPLYFSIHVLQLNSRSLIDLFPINKQITIQAIPTANEAGRLTADLHLSPCSSKSNPPVALQQNTYRSHPSPPASISVGSQSSPPNFFAPIVLSQLPNSSDTFREPRGHSDQGSKKARCRSWSLPSIPPSPIILPQF